MGPYEKIKTDRIITAFLSIALFVIMPFVYSRHLSDVEQSPRFLFIALICTISSLFLILLVSKINVRVTKNAFIPFLFIFTGLALIGFFRSINFGDGLFEFLKFSLIISLFIQFLVLFQIDEKNKFIFFKTISVSASVFIIIGWLQIIPAISDALSKNDAVNINYIIASSLGNKNFFAEVLLLMLPLAAFSIFYYKTFWKYFSLVVSLFIIVTLVILQSMATWIAIGFSSLILIIIVFRFKNKLLVSRKAKKAFYIGVASGLLILMISVISLFVFAENSRLHSRVDSFWKTLNSHNSEVINSNNSSISERLMLWKNSVNMIADHPIAGTGLGNWKILSNAYGLNPATYMTSGEIIFVHPHNDFLLVGSETGLPGLIIYLFLFVLLIYYSINKIKNGDDRINSVLALFLLFGLVAYMTISFFSMPLNRFYQPILLMLVAAMVVSNHLTKNKASLNYSKATVSICFAISLCIGIASTFVGYKRLLSDLNLTSALLNERKANYTDMRAHLKKIDRLYYPVDVAATPITWYLGVAEFRTGNHQKAFEYFQEAEKQNPTHLKVLNDLATCYNLSGDLINAKSYYLRALNIQPLFGDALINLSIIHYNSGHLDSAYFTLIKHHGSFSNDQIAVFSTILSAKAATLTSDTIVLAKFNGIPRSQVSITLLLERIRNHKNGLSGILKDLK